MDHTGRQSFGRQLKGFLMAPFKLSSYKNLTYLLLSFPLGLIYFIVLITGISLGIGTYLIVIGVPLLVAVLLLWRQLVKLEQLQAKWLLMVDTRPEPILRWAEAKRAWPWLRARLSSSLTWKGLAYLFLKFPLGLVAFILLVTLLALSAAMIAAPFVYNNPHIHYGVVDIANLGQALAVMVVGLVIAWLSLNILNGYTQIFRWLSSKMLTTKADPVTA